MQKTIKQISTWAEIRDQIMLHSSSSVVKGAGIGHGTYKLENRIQQLTHHVETYRT